LEFKKIGGLQGQWLPLAQSLATMKSILNNALDPEAGFNDGAINFPRQPSAPQRPFSCRFFFLESVE